MTAEQAMDRLRTALVQSSTFDNFECNFGPTLGTCPPSNHCVECEIYRTVSEYDGGKIDMSKVQPDH